VPSGDRAIRVAVVGYPTHAMTSRLVTELQRRRHHADVIHPDDLVTEVRRDGVVVHPFAEGRMPDAVVLTMSSDHVPAVTSAAQLERTGVPVANRPSAVLAAADKVQTAVTLANAGVPVPATIVITTVESALTCAPRIGYPLVLKAADGAEGNQVRLVAREDELAAAITELRSAMGQDVSTRSALLLQEVVQGSVGRDRRIFVVGGTAQAAMDRVAREGEWRSNLSQGARPVAAVATDDENEIAVRAARALGLDFTTVDLMVGTQRTVVIEANPYGDVLDVSMTSGLDLVGSLADLAELTAGRRPPGPVVPKPLSGDAHAGITAFCRRRLADKAAELGLDDKTMHGGR
jgi:RimK family alpha-L-glutamate ligase